MFQRGDAGTTWGLEIKQYRCIGRWEGTKKIKIIIILSTLPIQKDVERFCMLANKSTTACNLFPAVVKSFDICILSAFTTKHSNLSFHEHMPPCKIEKKTYLPQQLQKQSWESSSQQADQGYVSFPLLFLSHLQHLQLIWYYAKVVYNCM